MAWSINYLCERSCCASSSTPTGPTTRVSCLRSQHWPSHNTPIISASTRPSISSHLSKRNTTFCYYYPINKKQIVIIIRLASYREIQLSFENTAACILVPDEYLRSPPVPALTKALSSIAANRESAQAVFKWLATLGPLELRPFRSLLLSTALPQLVEPGVPRTLLDSYYAVWRLLSIVEPAAVWLDTWIAFSPATASDTDKPIASIDALQQNPLLVLQCRKHVLECPTLYAMLLQCLKGWIVGNHRWLASLPGPRAKRDGVTAAAATTKSINSVAGKTTLEIMQASAIVQMLLEVCQPLVHAKTAAANGENIGHWEEIAAMTCQFLHQLFIDFDNSARAAEVASTLPRLVHYQGYDLALLSLTVNGVASMRNCKSKSKKKKKKKKTFFFNPYFRCLL